MQFFILFASISINMAATEILTDPSGDGWVGTPVADDTYQIVQLGKIRFDLGDQRPEMNDSAWSPEAKANILARSASDNPGRRDK